MPEIEVRFPCPACLGAVMEKVRVGGALTLDHCRRCGGVWFGQGEVQRLRRLPSTELWRHVSLAPGVRSIPCHECHAPLDRDADACPACGASNRISCPECERPLTRQAGRGLVVDSCRGCRGVWLDHAELAAVWSAAAAVALLPPGGGPGVGDLAGGAAEVLVQAPELAFYGARASAEMLSMSVEAVAAAPEAALGAAEAASEAAGSIFLVVLEVLGSLLEGL